MVWGMPTSLWEGKILVTSAPVLKAPDYQKPCKLQIDTSDVVMGAVLLQESPQGIDHPVSYYSRKFNSHQDNCSTSEKEALALLSALQHFDVYLSAAVAPVEAFTDHNPLVFIHKMKNKNQRLLRWSLALQEYRLIIRHIRGKDNIMADALSRATEWSTEWHWWHVHCFFRPQLYILSLLSCTLYRQSSL